MVICSESNVFLKTGGCFWPALYWLYNGGGDCTDQVDKVTIKCKKLQAFLPLHDLKTPDCETKSWISKTQLSSLILSNYKTIVIKYILLYANTISHYNATKT